MGSIRAAVKALSATCNKADFQMAIDLIHLAKDLELEIDSVTLGFLYQSQHFSKDCLKELPVSIQSCVYLCKQVRCLSDLNHCFDIYEKLSAG
jgi:hypothetical protein